jgi:FkbM family methyltransferase
MTRWSVRVALSRWKRRVAYVARAPMVYRNWWAIALPKLGYATVLHLRDGRRYRVRPRTLDLSIVNEAAFLNPYLSNGFVSLRADSVVVDVGANLGDFAIQAACLCPAGRIIAVEPIRSAGEMIEQQAHLNGVSNVTWICAAMGREDRPAAAIRSGSPYARTDADHGGVEMVTLARLAADQHLDRIDLLKLDCEGAEWDILPSSDAVLPRVRQICMEFHCERGWTAERLAEWLKNRGFDVIHTGGSWNGLLWARRSLL